LQINLVVWIRLGILGVLFDQKRNIMKPFSVLLKIKYIAIKWGDIQASDGMPFEDEVIVHIGRDLKVKAINLFAHNVMADIMKDPFIGQADIISLEILFIDLIKE